MDLACLPVGDGCARLQGELQPPSPPHGLSNQPIRTVTPPPLQQEV